MSEKTLTFTTTLVTVECAECSMTFAMPKDFAKNRRRDHSRFYCPTGHGLSYPAQSEEEILRDQLADWRRWYGELEAEAKYEKQSHAATKGQLTKTRKRIAAGVCPHCHRTFQNVARHMVSKHPETTNE